MKIKLIILVLLFPLMNTQSQHYEFNKTADYSLLATGLSFSIASIYLKSDIDILSIDIIDILDPNEINLFDRFVTENYSMSAAGISDIMLYSMTVAPTSLLFANKSSGMRNEIGLMITEAHLLTYGLTQLSKVVIQRIRPFIYNKEVPLAEKLEKDAQYSFFSGHTSTVFTSAVLISTIFSKLEINPDYDEIVWGISLLSAGTVAVLRVVAGKHFFSDVLVGAIVGSLSGYLVPKLHEVSNSGNNKSTENQFIIPISIAL